MITKEIWLNYDGNNFGQFIKDMRLNLSLTQMELSEIAESRGYSGLSHSSIRNYEQGKHVPKFTQDIIDALIEIFKDDLERRNIRINITVGKPYDI